MRILASLPIADAVSRNPMTPVRSPADLRLTGRLFFAIGPGDLVASYDCWIANRRMLSETSLTYSGQVLDFCRSSGCRAMLISSCQRPAARFDQLYIVENRPKLSLLGGRGVWFYLRELLYAISLAVSARRFRAEVAVIDSGTSSWFMCWIFRLLGIRVVPCFHNVYANEGAAPSSMLKRLVTVLDSHFFRHGTEVALGVSSMCARQYRQLGGEAKAFKEFRAQFAAADFQPREHVLHAKAPFRIVFVGRVERNKGVFDLLEIANRLQTSAQREIRLDICGNGAALAEVKHVVAKRDMARYVFAHGRLERVQLLDVYRQCHLVVVPTRFDFCEGLPQVCAEAVLMGKPVVTSRISNALEVIGAAASVAEPEDIDSYVARIAELVADPELYQRRVNACNVVAHCFMDPSQGIASALDRALRPWIGSTPLA